MSGRWRPYNTLHGPVPVCQPRSDMDKRSRLHTYIRPRSEVTYCPSGPDGSRSLAPYLLVVVADARRVEYQVSQEPV